MKLRSSDMYVYAYTAHERDALVVALRSYLESREEGIYVDAVARIIARIIEAEVTA